MTCRWSWTPFRFRGGLGHTGNISKSNAPPLAGVYSLKSVVTSSVSFQSTQSNAALTNSAHKAPRASSSVPDRAFVRRSSDHPAMIKHHALRPSVPLCNMLLTPCLRPTSIPRPHHSTYPAPSTARHLPSTSLCPPRHLPSTSLCPPLPTAHTSSSPTAVRTLSRRAFRAGLAILVGGVMVQSKRSPN